jgi:uncharacterized lipoprotein
MEEVYASATQETDEMAAADLPIPELEAEMLRRLMLRFGVQEARARAQITTAASKAAPRATLSKGGSSSGVGSLALHEQFDRAWRSVGLALDRVGFTVEDRDRSKGLYYVRYIDPLIDNKQPESQAGMVCRAEAVRQQRSQEGGAVPHPGEGRRRRCPGERPEQGRHPGQFGHGAEDTVAALRSAQVASRRKG